MTEPRPIACDLSRVALQALEWGDPDRPLALCLHGYPDTAWTWRHLGPYLAELGWHVVAPFLRGYAPSGCPEDGAYEIGALVRDTVELHASLHRGGRSVLIGHDFGAAAAYGTSAFRPELFDRIATLAIPPLPCLVRTATRPRHAVTLLRQMRCSWYTMFQQVPGLSERAMPRVIPRLWADWSPGYDARFDLEQLAPTLADPIRRRALLRYYRTTGQPWARHPAYADERRAWRSMPTVPVLCLHGVQDGCVLSALVEDPTPALPVGSRFERVPGAGHFLHLEQPDRVNQMIGDFFGDPV